MRYGTFVAVRWVYVVFSPMIRKTCPNAGTPSDERVAAALEDHVPATATSMQANETTSRLVIGDLAAPT